MYYEAYEEIRNHKVLLIFEQLTYIIPISILHFPIFFYHLRFSLFNSKFPFL